MYFFSLTSALIVFPRKQCATHTWYLAVDFQLYAVSPLAIFAFKRRPLFGVVLTLLLVASGALLALLPPLLSAHTLPAMYSMDTILSDDAISHHFRLVSPP
jgi:peptidoglycan/LPS O-acetylase OafA/YrhL